MSPLTQLSFLCNYWQMSASPHLKSWLPSSISLHLLAPYLTLEGRTPTVAMETALDYHKWRALRSDQDKHTETFRTIANVDNAPFECVLSVSVFVRARVCVCVPVPVWQWQRVEPEIAWAHEHIHHLCLYIICPLLWSPLSEYKNMSLPETEGFWETRICPLELASSTFDECVCACVQGGLRVCNLHP